MKSKKYKVEMCAKIVFEKEIEADSKEEAMILVEIGSYRLTDLVIVDFELESIEGCEEVGE